MKLNKHLKIIIPLTIALIIVIASWFYLTDYYPADVEAISTFSYSESITKTYLEDNIISYVPENATAGFIFYPGGKVEYTSYEPLMFALAERNILCIIIEMPFNLAIFDVNAANGIKNQYPNIQNWYIGGHSLGGAMAASYISNNTSDFCGLVLLAAYSTSDLSDSNLNVISIYGSEDRVLNKEKYNKYKTNLPKDTSEHIIEGGNHAHFGMYGAQKGDGIPSINNTEQINTTADIISKEIVGK